MKSFSSSSSLSSSFSYILKNSHTSSFLWWYTSHKNQSVALVNFPPWYFQLLNNLFHKHFLECPTFYGFPEDKTNPWHLEAFIPTKQLLETIKLLNTTCPISRYIVGFFLYGIYLYDTYSRFLSWRNFHKYLQNVDGIHDIMPGCLERSPGTNSLLLYKMET